MGPLPFAEAEIEASIIDRWRRVVAQFPEEIALTSADGERYSYHAVDQTSDRLACALIAACGTANEPVLLLLDHAPAMLISIIGVLKANKAYVALDPTQAPEQLQRLSEASAATLIVTDVHHLPLAQTIATPAQQIWLLENLPAADADGPDLLITPDAIAAILFTSGTSSRPKGVPRNHRGILHQAWFDTTLCHFGPGDQISGLRQCGLGGGVPDIFNALLNGATYALYPLQTYGLQGLSAWLQAESITYFHPPLVLFRQWLETLPADAFFPQLRQILPSGRQTSSDLTQLWPHVLPACVVLTSYSATETNGITRSVLDRFTPIDEGVLHVGQPLPGKQVLIRRADGEWAVTGEVGEVVVRSRYIAASYWRQPELTAEHFALADDGSGEILYRTSDLGRLDQAGCLELVGRQDSQVKLRGYRVVLGEVEDALHALPSVQAAAVTADEERGLLFAYVIAATEPPPLPSAMRTALAERLPYYALPTHIIFLTHFPMLPSGKVNRRALPAPEINRTGLNTLFLPPRNAIESQLVAIWEALLNVHPIGIADHFFDLGGHSILAMRLLHAVEQQFHQPIALRQFIFNPTIAYLATLLNTKAGSTPPDEEQDTALSNMLDNAELRALYDALEDKREIDRRRNQLRVKPPLPRPLQHLLRLPQPVALPLLYQVLHQPWVQQRYLAYRTALVQQFLAGLEDPPSGKALVGHCLFFGALSYFEVRQLIFLHLQRANQISVDGVDALTAARSRQQGVILLTSHNYQSPYFRSFRLTQGWIGNLTLLTRNRQFDKGRAEQILYARQLELARQTLQQGGALYIAPDVNRGHGTSITVPFHGRMHEFRTSFADLALLTDAQIFFVASDLHAYDRFSFQLVGPFDRGAAAMSYTERVHHLMDQYVAHLRQQWSHNPWALPWWLMREHLSYPSVDAIVDKRPVISQRNGS